MTEEGGGGKESFLRCLYSLGWSEWPQMVDPPALVFSRAWITGIRISVYMGRVVILGMEIVCGKDLG